MQPEATVRVAQPGELRGEALERLADMHLRSLPASLFSRAGRGAVRGLYHAMAGDERELFVIASHGGRVLGGAVTTLSPTDFSGRMLRHPRVLAGLLAGAWRLPWGRMRDHAPGGSGAPELLFLFVDDGQRGSGLGAALVARTLAELQRRGFNALNVRTEDAPSNRALAFYDRLGFRRIAQVRQYGDPYVLFGREL